MRGTVEGIWITADAKGEPRAVDAVRAIEGAGLEGDRYARGEGTFSAKPGAGRQVTLVAAEAVDDLAADGIHLSPGDLRRNVVTRGVDLDALLGHRFRIGDVVLEAVRPCPPCGHLQGLTVTGIVAALQDKGGLRADVVVGGELRVGDAVEVLREIEAATA